jgi:GNAT superfamily N-acetyltransferase
MRPSERVEVEALRSLFSVPSPAGALREAGEAVAVRVDGMPGRELNRIAGLYDLALLDELAGVFDGRQYWISLDPGAGLDEELMTRGYARDGAWQKFERGTEPVASSTDLNVAEARSGGDVATYLRTTWQVPEDAAQWLAMLTGHPDWHCFLAYDGEEPVAGAMLFAHEGAGWLGVAATRVEFRGRGAQSSLLAARIDRGRELGLRLLVTETGAAEGAEPGTSYRNILRAGFEPAYVRPNYTASGAGSSSSSGSRP